MSVALAADFTLFEPLVRVISLAPGYRPSNMLRLIQLQHPQQGRRLAIVEKDDRLRLLEGVYSAYELAQSALARGSGLEETAQGQADREILEYEPIHKISLSA